MPGLAVVFSSPLFCRSCGIEMAPGPSYAHLGDSSGSIILFNDADPPATLVIAIECKNGHRSSLPSDASVHWWLAIDRSLPAADCRTIAQSWIRAKPRALVLFYRFMARTRPFSTILWLLIAPAVYSHGIFHDSKAYMIGLAIYVLFTISLAVFPWEVYLRDAIRTGVETPG